MEKKERLHIYFNETESSQYALKVLNDLKERDKNANLTELLGMELLAYKKLLDKDQSIQELAVLLADEVAKSLRPFALRSANADKNSRIILEVLNGMLLQGHYQDIVTTDELLTSPLKKAIGKVENDLESIIRRNKERKTDLGAN